MKGIGLIFTLLFSTVVTLGQQFSPPVDTVYPTFNAINFEHTDGTESVVPCQAVATIRTTKVASRIISVFVNDGEFERVISFDWQTCGFASKADALSSITDWSQCTDSSAGVFVDSTELVYDEVLNYQNAPPVGPDTGATYLVGNSPTGAWASNAKDLAEWDGAAWVFTTPSQGDYVYNTANALTYQFRSGSWVRVGGISALHNGNSISTGLRLGTNNQKSFVFETNNTAAGRIDSIQRWHFYSLPTAGVGDTINAVLDANGKMAKSPVFWYPGSGGISSIKTISATTSSANFSVASGYHTVASGEHSHAVNQSTTASGNSAFSSGNATTSSGYTAFSSGDANTSSGGTSFTGGFNNTASGVSSVVFGRNSTASDTATIVFGSSITGTLKNTVYANNLYITDSTITAPQLKTDVNADTIMMLENGKVKLRPASTLSGSTYTLSKNAGLDSTVLTGSDGSRTAAKDSIGAFVLLSTTNASGASTVEFTGITSAYTTYKIIGSDLVGSAAVELCMQIGTGAGPTWQSGATDYSWIFNNVYYAGTGAGTGATSQSGGWDGNDTRMTLTYVWNGAGDATELEVSIPNPANTGIKQVIRSESSCFINTTQINSLHASGTYLANTAVTGFKIFPASGTVTGTFKLYGIK